MKSPLLKGVVFISKSLLWSVVLYVVCMLAINWDNIHTTVKENGHSAIVQRIKLLPHTPIVTIIPNSTIPQTNTPSGETFFPNTTAILTALYNITTVHIR